MSRRLLLLAGLLAALAGAGCEDDGYDYGTVFENPRGTVDVEKGKRFSLEFTVNGAVGIDWEPVGVSAGAALVNLEDTKLDYPDEMRAGESGTKRFVYTANGAGRQALVFRRTFRGDPQERRTIRVNIRG